METSTQAFHDTNYVIEIWILFGIGMTVLAIRFFVRLRTVGICGFQGDDYLCMLLVVCHVLDATSITLCYYYGTNTDFPPATLSTLTHKEIEHIELGTRWQFLAWHTYTMLLWTLKGCFLFFFLRLTIGLEEQRWVKLIGIATIGTYLGMFLTIMLSCLPIRRNWQVQPPPPLKCSFRRQNFIVCAVLNISTDLAILAIPLPLVIRMRVPLYKRMLIGLLLCGGIFVIVAATIRVAMTLGSNPSALNINRWGLRETIAGLLAVNAPIIKPFFTKGFWQTDEQRLESRQAVALRRRESQAARTGVRGKIDSVFRKLGVDSLMSSLSSTIAAANTITTVATNTTMTMNHDHELVTMPGMAYPAPQRRDENAEQPSRMSVVSSEAHPGHVVDLERGQSFPTLYRPSTCDGSNVSQGPQAVWNVEDARSVATA